MRMFLVPGFTQTTSAWADVIEALPLRSDVVALDVPVADSFIGTIEALAQAGGPGCWVGYSMGARLVLSLALARPEVVQRVVLVSGGLGISDPDGRADRAATDDALAEQAERVGADAFLDAWLAQPMFADVPSSARAHRLTDGSAIAHQLRVLGTGQMPPLHDRLATLTTPVLLITGTDDEKFDAIATEATAALPHATHVRIAGGHALIHTAPGDVARAIAAFNR